MQYKLALACCAILLQLPLSFADDRSATIRGRIVALSTTKVAPHAQVSLFVIDQVRPTPQIELVRIYQTNGAGEYEFAGLRSGTFLIGASMPGFIVAKAWDVYVETGGSRTVDLGLVATGGDFKTRLRDELVGRVTSASGKPVEDATVTLVQFDGSREVFQGRTDGQGRYRVAVVHIGEYAVQVSKPGLASAHSIAEIRGKAEKHFTLQEMR